MWFLQGQDGIIGGKRIWLKPGTTHVIGRTVSQEPSKRTHIIDDRSISRKHCELTVSPIEPGQVPALYQRTKLVIQDLSKVGTSINGQTIGKGATKSVDNKSAILNLGTLGKTLTLTWTPCNFAFTNVKKSSKQPGDPIADRRALLEPYDIKCTTTFDSAHTSHVLTKKRNTPAGLQALLHGRLIVVEGFVQAVVQAATRPSNDQDAHALSPLETDFDAHWPKEIEYLPPPGLEPNPRPENDPIFSPNPDRDDLFHNYTFIFTTKPQHDQLSMVVNGGRGKALLHLIPPESENPDMQDMITFVTEAAERRLGHNERFRLSQQPTKASIVVIRPNEREQAGGARYWERLDLALDQRSMEQNEFLEAILTCDPASLRRPLELASQSGPANQSLAVDIIAESGNEPAEVPAADVDMENDSVPAEVPSQAADVKPRFRRHITKSRFADMDDFDDFNPSQITRKQPLSSQAVPSAPPSQRPQTLRRPSYQLSDVVGSPDFEPSHTTRKRGISQVEPIATTNREPEPTSESDHDLMDDILTGTAAAKKRRLNRDAQPAVHMPESEKQSNRAESQVKNDQPLDVRKAIQDRNKATTKRTLVHAGEDDDGGEEHTEALLAQLYKLDFAAAQDKLQIDEEDLLRTDRPLRSGNSDDSQSLDSTRWKEEWNGRPNYKKFRKSRPGSAVSEATNTTTGQSQRSQRSQHRVIVPVALYDPASASGFADEDSWLVRAPRQGTTTGSRKSTKQRQQQEPASTSFQRSRRSGGQISTATTSQRASSRADQYNNDNNNNDSVDGHDDSNEDDSDDGSTNEPDALRRAIENTRAEEAARREADEHFSSEIVGRSRRADYDSEIGNVTTASVGGSRSSRAAVAGTLSNNTWKGTAGTSAANGRKRAASRDAGPPAKRMTQSRLVGGRNRINDTNDDDNDDNDDDDDDDDGDVRFRRRRR